MDGFIRTGVDSWSSKWGSEYDIIKLLREEMGEAFPQHYYCAVRVVGIYEQSGTERYEWYLIDDTDRKAPAVVITRPAIKQISKKSGKAFYQVTKRAITLPGYAEVNPV